MACVQQSFHSKEPGRSLTTLSIRLTTHSTSEQHPFGLPCKEALYKGEKIRVQASASESGGLGALWHQRETLGIPVSFHLRQLRDCPQRVKTQLKPKSNHVLEAVTRPSNKRLKHSILDRKNVSSLVKRERTPQRTRNTQRQQNSRNEKRDFPNTKGFQSFP